MRGKPIKSNQLIFVIIILLISFIILFNFINQKKIELYYCPQSDGYVGEIPDENIHDNGLLGGGIL